MKRGLTMLVFVAVILGTVGCTRQQWEQEGVPVSFYYVTRNAEQLREDMVVASETRHYSAFSLQELLEIYFNGPKSEELVSPFPNGTRTLEVRSTDGQLTLKLSGEYFALNGVELSVANCCLASTVCTYAEVDSVMLEDETGTIYMEVRPTQYLLSNNIAEESDEAFTVYFSDADRRYLVAETRAATLSENETAMAYVMRQLFEGPESGQLLEVIPKGTELLSIRCDDGVCTVDLSSEFYENLPNDSYCIYTTLYGITNTLTSLPDIQSVLFLEEGAPVEHYGIFSLQEPIARNADAIGPVRAGSGEMDVNVYVLNSETGAMFAVPCRIKQTISQPLAEAVTAQVLSYEAFPGFYNPIPFGTELLSISVSGSVCYVDVSDKFIPPEDTEQAEKEAVWALVTSLTELDNISSVVLTIEGESGGLSYVDISEPLTRRGVMLH